MKKLFLILILNILLFTGCYGGRYYRNTIPPEPPHRVRYYDKHNRYTGYSEYRYNRTRYYDKYGRYQGYSINNRNYDNHGKFIGSSRR